MMRHCVLLAVFAALAASTGCWATKPACAVIRTAADVCTYIEYIGADGKTYRVPVASRELNALAKQAAEKQGLPPPPPSP